MESSNLSRFRDSVPYIELNIRVNAIMYVLLSELPGLAGGEKRQPLLEHMILCTAQSSFVRATPMAMLDTSPKSCTAAIFTKPLYSTKETMQMFDVEHVTRNNHINTHSVANNCT